MTAALAEVPAPDGEVTEPGIHYDLDEIDYHADPVPEGSLSVSGAKRLLPPSCPQLFKWERDNGRLPKRQFDFGHAAHKLVLGAGLDIVVIEADNYRTKAAQEQQKEARERGAVALLRDEWATVQAMAEALRAHPIARLLLADGSGRPEVSLFWRDDRTGVMRRGRLDWLRETSPDGRLILVDYKSAASASPQKFRNAAADYGYHMQAPWYVDGVKALDIAEDVAFVFVVQEKTPPYLVSVVEIDSLGMRIGRHDNAKAIDVYVECMTKDYWPSYSDDVELVSLPGWVEHRYEQETA